MNRGREEGKPGDQVKRRHTGLAALADEDFSLSDAIGGWRGMVESVLPGLVFLIVFLVSGNLVWTILISGLLSFIQLLIRLIQRQSFLGALTGLLGVGICLIAAWLSKDARNYYLPGFLINMFWILVLGLSLICRVPGIGFLIEYVRKPVVSGFRSWLASWRDKKNLMRAYVRVTLIWIAVFTLRLLVQVPLYFLGSIGPLGAARLILGLPLFALAIWISWLLIREPYHLRDINSEPPGADNSESRGSRGAVGSGVSED